MNDTVVCTNVQNWWNGKVLIDEIKMYVDSRGMVSEVWRIDSLMGKDSKQCYISETAPYVMRGPHSHRQQVDEFVSWKNNMVYQMYNPETKEMKTFITEKNKIYRVHVSIGIIHSYRNLDSQKSFTLNFPTSLFMGEGKKETIDEIRHEQKYEHNDVIVVFGASGKLGADLTSEFFANMGEHKYDVIPSYEKLKSKEEIVEFFGKLDLALDKNRKVYFFNCAAITNVQDVNTEESIWEWSNVSMPVEFAKECNTRRWNYVQFSTDYVYQRVESNIINYSLSSYTRSKIRMEVSLKNLKLNNISIIRVANLFANNDNHNVIYKMYKALKETGAIKVDLRLKIFPTHVSDLSKSIFNLYSSQTIGKNATYTSADYNLVPSHSYFLSEFVKQFFGIEPILENGRIKPWHEEFVNKSHLIFDSNPELIRKLITEIT